MNSISNRNNVKVVGNGEKVMLFAHGFGCDQNSWQFVTDAFKDDYKLVLFDYVGAGKSDLSAYSSSRYGRLEGYAQDILEVCDELKLNNTILVGHSVSSMIGLLAAIEQPSFFNKLVFVGPSPRYLNDENYHGGFEKADLEALFEFMDSNYLGWSSQLAPAIMGNPDRPELGEFLTSSFCSTNPDIAREFARVTFFSDNRKDLQNLKVESLTLQCNDDIIAPLNIGSYILENTPLNKLHIMEASGHCPHISHPQETIAAIKAFLN
ncbi:alpha/beta fold hydrolase [Desertivirga xinjiangensis]|uniref:alpha/beta fold hydrolase n=1 Tax=Desertivirga xinjiangensis TaxID=539206 RepID=UPI00210ACB2E|nr:alpha/beta hydrolase [Pedobacter xinjiangensis]